VHEVLVAGAIVTPLSAMAMVIADGWGGLRHPFDLSSSEPDRATVERAGAGWRFAFWANRANRIGYRLGFVGGVLCLATAAVAKLASL
jgi:hypothetical protein